MNHDMSVTDHDTLADRRTEVTRSAIVDAVVVALEEEHPAALRMDDIARRAGVTVRTVYRYFPTKQALLDEVAEIQRRRVEAMSGSARALYDDQSTWLPALWRTFADDITSVRAQHRAAIGSKLRATRLEESRRGVRVTFAREHPHLSDADLDRLVDGVIAVTSSSMFLELHDRMGWDVDEAAQMSLWMVDALIDRAEESR